MPPMLMTTGAGVVAGSAAAQVQFVVAEDEDEEVDGALGEVYEQSF